MYANNYISSIVSRQLPEFVRADHPRFVLLLEKYYEYMEQEGKTNYVGKRLYDYMDVDTTRADLLHYFKTKIISSFPEQTELSKEKLIKAARDFYDKKGTPEGFKFLFRVLYGQEIDVYFPKEDILRASDGKWKLPQALRISISDTSTLVTGGNVNVAIATANVVQANGINFLTENIAANSYIRIGTEKRKVISVGASSLSVDIPFSYVSGTQIYDSADLYKLTLSEYSDFDFNLLERRKGEGSVSHATCIIESAVRSVDKNSGREIVELYVSNIKKGFETNENIEISYIDPVTNTTAVFSSKIISLISNISLFRNRFGVVQSGSRYKIGDPVVFYGGLSNSDEATKAVANVKTVSVGTLDSVTLTSPGYYYRSYANSIVHIDDATGIGANLLIGAVSSHVSNSAAFKFNTDSIYYKKDVLLNAADYGFANLALAKASSQIGIALSYDTHTLGEITFLNLKNRGSFFEAVPVFDPISVYDTDYSADVDFVNIPVNTVSNYNKTLKTIQLPSGFSSVDNFYVGARLFIDVGSTAHHSTIVAYDGTTKVATLDKPFENNITSLNAANFRYFLDFRGDVRSTGRLGAIEILNGGTGYSSGDKIEFIGTGYGAAASLTITSGVVTGVTLTNRGEGYVDRPTCRVVNSTGGTSTGSGAVFVAYTLSDGEQIDATTSGIGEIQSFNLIDRGYDYVETPVVSLKVADILTNDLPDDALVVSGDLVWQGGATNEDATFTAIVDDIYRPDNTLTIIRIFDYNGTFNATSPLKINTATQNVSTTPLTATGTYSFRDIDLATSRNYPQFYGNGLAKANATFASGLIKYEGYYLNTDGHVSADKKLQNKNYYHNFSYEIQSEKPLDDYKKTIYDVAHPAGMQLLSKFNLKDEISLSANTASNIDYSPSVTTQGYALASRIYFTSDPPTINKDYFVADVLNASKNIVRNMIPYVPQYFAAGDLVKLNNEIREIVSIDSSTQFTVNTAFSTALAETSVYKYTTLYPTLDTDATYSDGITAAGYSTDGIYADFDNDTTDLSTLNIEIGDLIELNSGGPILRRYIREVVGYPTWDDGYGVYGSTATSPTDLTKIVSGAGGPYVFTDSFDVDDIIRANSEVRRVITVDPNFLIVNSAFSRAFTDQNIEKGIQEITFDGPATAKGDGNVNFVYGSTDVTFSGNENPILLYTMNFGKYPDGFDRIHAFMREANTTLPILTRSNNVITTDVFEPVVLDESFTAPYYVNNVEGYGTLTYSGVPGSYTLNNFLVDKNVIGSTATSPTDLTKIVSGTGGPYDFNQKYVVGDYINANSEIRQISTIDPGGTYITVSPAFSTAFSNKKIFVEPVTISVGDNINFNTPNCSLIVTGYVLEGPSFNIMGTSYTSQFTASNVEYWHAGNVSSAFKIIKRVKP